MQTLKKKNLQQNKQQKNIWKHEEADVMLEKRKSKLKLFNFKHNSSVIPSVVCVKMHDWQQISCALSSFMWLRCFVWFS